MRVLKVGGNELSDPAFVAGLAKNAAQIHEDTGQALVIVHGGGKAIAEMQSKLGLDTIKVDGLRVTDEASLSVAEMVLSGHSNKILVKALLDVGLDTVGISGVDGGLLRCKKKVHPTADLGLVGEIIEVRVDLLERLINSNLVIVLSPISLGLDGLTYNVNADEAASAVALSTGAAQLDFISNVPGVLNGQEIVNQLTAVETEQLIGIGVISGGMIPKVRSALQAVEQGVNKARIVNLDGLAGDGGTSFYKNPNKVKQ